MSELKKLSESFTCNKKNGSRTSINKGESPQKKSVQEFDEYYKKSFEKFLKKKESDLEKKKKQIEEAEAVELKHKPNLISKQQNNNRIPLVDRMAYIKAKKEKEIARMKKEKEEKEERELKELTFAPKINSNSVSLSSSRNSVNLSHQTNTKNNADRKIADKSPIRGANQKVVKPANTKIEKKPESQVIQAVSFFFWVKK